MALEQWTVKDILQWTSQRFSQQELPTPLLDAQLLLASVLGLSKVQLYMAHDRVLSADERTRMRELVKRRVSGEPVAYLLGRKEWHELDLHLDARVLIPRPETETLLDFAFEAFRGSKRTPTAVLDLCTGSGCLAISFAKRYPDAKVIAVDISEDALAVARENARRNGTPQVEFVLGDVTDPSLYATLANKVSAQGGRFSVIVANPPYVSESEWNACDVGVRDFEPKLALVAEDEGLAIGRALLRLVEDGALLAAHGVFGMELGLAHCGRLRQEQGSEAGTEADGDEPRSFPYNTAAWKFPRGAGFALQDLTGRERFWARVSGLPYAEFAVVDETRRMAKDEDSAGVQASLGGGGQVKVTPAQVEAQRRVVEEAALAAAAREDDGFFEEAP